LSLFYLKIVLLLNGSSIDSRIITWDEVDKTEDKIGKIYSNLDYQEIRELSCFYSL